MSDFKTKLAEVKQQRLDLRAKVLADFEKNPTAELSEILRKIDSDILFWDAQVDHSLEGLLKTIEASIDNLRDWS